MITLKKWVFKCVVLNTFNLVLIKIGDKINIPKKNLKKAAVKTLVSCWASFIKTDIAALKKTDNIISGIYKFLLFTNYRILFKIFSLKNILWIITAEMWSKIKPIKK